MKAKKVKIDNQSKLIRKLQHELQHELKRLKVNSQAWLETNSQLNKVYVGLINSHI